MLDLRTSSPVYSRVLGEVTAEVYLGENGYNVFLVGDAVASFLGTGASLEDCKEEIKALERLVNSDLYKREIAKYC